MALALVLGSMAESAMKQSLIMSHGNPVFFFKPPIAPPLMLISIILFAWPSISSWRKRAQRKRRRRESENGQGTDEPKRGRKIAKSNNK
jgi:TctA family transporter